MGLNLLKAFKKRKERRRYRDRVVIQSDQGERRLSDEEIDRIAERVNEKR